VSDAEQGPAGLSCAWQTILHHNNHIHTEPIDPNCTTSTTISPVGCDGNTYYYSVLLTVTDSAGLSTTAEARLYPDCADFPPTISGVADQTINEDTATALLSVTVGDAETPATSLVLSGASSNPVLVPNANILFGGSGSNRTVKVQPASNQSGVTTITLTVSDGTGTASTSFNVTVNAVNDPPTISDIPNQTTAQDTATPAIGFTVQDIDTPLASLTLSGSSGNQTLVPNGNIVFGGSGANRTVQITPVAGQNGTAAITVRVSDGSGSASDSFVLTVTAPPPPFSGANINFQPASAPAYPGYLVDGGAVFGARNGLSYGWSVDNSAYMIDRNASKSPDQRYDTLCQMQQAGNANTWELAVPNGNYDVNIVAGDAANPTGSIRINVEGVLVVSGDPSPSNRWISGRKTVAVSDGRLTVTNGAGARNNKICFIDITKVP